MHITRRLSLGIFLGLLAYMPLHIFLSTWLGTSLGILAFAKVAKDIVLVIGFVLALIASLQEAWLKAFFQSRITQFIGAYAALTVLLALVRPTDSDAEILAVVYNLRFFLFFLYAALLTGLYRRIQLTQKAVRLMLAVAAIVMVFGVMQYVILPDDVLTHVGYSKDNGVRPAFFIDNKPDLERIMSTIRDPNSFGSYLIIVASFGIVLLLRNRHPDARMVAKGTTALSLLCLWFTFSRSAWLGLLVAVAALLFFTYRSRVGILFKSPLLIVVSLIVITLSIGLYAARNTYFVSNVVFHSDASTKFEDPNQLRLRFWQKSVEEITDNPVGHGPGTAGLTSIRNDEKTLLNENYYLQIAHEVGVLGLALFLAICIMAAYSLYLAAPTSMASLALLISFTGLAFTNLLVHIWSNEAVAYTWWGLAGLYTARASNILTPRKTASSKKRSK